MAVPTRSIPSGDGRPAEDASLRLQILGPPRIWHGGVELDPGPRQQTRVLALLLARAGKPISAPELIDLIWDDDVPASALNVIHKYVGVLRRLLEPGLPVRGVGSFILRRGNGYLFTVAPGTLDLAVFREHVVRAEAARAQRRYEAALDHYVRGLGLWRGPAGDGLAHGRTMTSVFAALDAELYEACVAAADLAVSLPRPERVLPALQLAASMAPLHEPVQAGLVRALAAAGRQAEALSVFGAVRARLVEDLGVDPGPTLLAAHRQVLTRTPPPATATEPDPRSHPYPDMGMDTDTDSRVGCPSAGTAGALVGRTKELAALRRTMEPAFTGGTAVGIVQGEPGVGKTHLLEEAAAEAARRGALVVRGRCLNGEGTPPMWPWAQAIGALVDALPSVAREKWLQGELGRLVEPPGDEFTATVLPEGGVRFRLFERVVAVLGEAAAERPVVLVIDDLQWADGASLELFGHVAARLPGGTVLLGALRDRAPAPGPRLSRTLAAVSRTSGHRRFRLGPITPDAVAELVRHETGRATVPDAARTLHARTAGNPFLARELIRLLADGGALTDATAARAGVPTTVRDVVLDRMACLDSDTRDLVQAAALIGPDVELGLLARVVGADAESCLEHLEPLTALGILEPGPDDPFSFRFAHDLVRETVRATMPPSRASRLRSAAREATGRDPPDRNRWTGAVGPLAMDRNRWSGPQAVHSPLAGSPFPHSSSSGAP
ncbi:BREX system ATP-binding domain-containing protein [Streptomyces sp. NPDC091280]|uniref:BREX system ATP-binding domain-containing protein n=1 Tax=Streptomyces sp. NPDC091280 TaxID=3365984 RepID=UPI0038175AC8